LPGVHVSDGDHHGGPGPGKRPAITPKNGGVGETRIEGGMIQEGEGGALRGRPPAAIRLIGERDGVGVDRIHGP